MKTNSELVALMRELVRGGMSVADACRQMMADHGLSLDQAADLAWRLTSGKAPRQMADGSWSGLAASQTTAHAEDE